ncbi:MAG: aminoglycoside phosphotransferase family protein [Armatimonadetes bacterium]|nr:aminoglycoside phosphotransferase family protein [Armatimonadota bacterium]
MSGQTKHDLSEIVSHFRIDGDFLDAVPYGSGHINDTYAARFKVGDGVVRYIHQRINHNIFKEPEKLMRNIERVTSHAREQIVAAGGDPDRETLNLVPTLDGKSFYRSPEGDYWRTYIFIEGAMTYDQVEDLNHVYSASRAFGEFQRLMSSLPGERLHETIPNFHHTRKRFEAFVAALEKDAMNRASGVKAEIDFVLAREADTSVVVDLLARGQLPERVTHNDTKLNNVMIDDLTGEGVCVIDLDTVMPGSALYDFGDSVRIGASTSVEDERDLGKVGMSLDMFDRLAHGYMDAARDFLTPNEIDYLPFSAKLMTFECGMRFLADHLSGDTYFKIHRDGHNLDRCRTQFKMVAEMEQQTDLMDAIVAKLR